MKKTSSHLLVLLLLTLSPLALAKHGDKVPGRFIVILNEEDSKNADFVIEASLKDSGIAKKDHSKHLLKKFKNRAGYVAKLDAKNVQKLKKDPRVKYVEQDHELRYHPDKKYAVKKKNKPSSLQEIPWGVVRIGGPKKVSSKKTAWVIDTGASPTHPDLNYDMGRSRSFVDYEREDLLDGYGHGTLVAGVIAAKDNGAGIVGVAPGVKVVSLKVFDNNGTGYLSWLIEAVDHVGNSAQKDDAVNISIRAWGSEALDSSVKAAAAKGILFSIAAGNGSDDSSLHSPSGVDAPGVYIISAMDSSNKFTSWSSFGASVDYCAPGLDILSTTSSGDYGLASGTSLSAPHVTGILLDNGIIKSDGVVSGDVDKTPDPIAHR